MATARSLPLPTLATRLGELEKDAAIYCICLRLHLSLGQPQHYGMH
ncbi:MAG: hypothetical protein HGA45_20495 [Chloroflexales bacterium]|nr:hypothetical protein [Chloroflexales bacterium]